MANENTGEIGFCSICGKSVDVALPNEDREQWRVFAAVKRRGYVDGWEPGQFLARQVAKFAEELGELAAELSSSLPGSLSILISDAADRGKYQFDHGEWRPGYFTATDLEQIWKELADLQVVLFCAAMAANELLGQKRDITQAALEKAEKDIQRGMR